MGQMPSMSPYATATGEMVSQGTRKREIDKDWMKAVVMLLGMVKNGDLLYRLILNNAVKTCKATQGSQNQCAPMVAHEGWIATSH